MNLCILDVLPGYVSGNCDLNQNDPYVCKFILIRILDRHCTLKIVLTLRIS